MKPKVPKRFHLEAKEKKNIHECFSSQLCLHCHTMPLSTTSTSHITLIFARRRHPYSFLCMYVNPKVLNFIRGTRKTTLSTLPHYITVDNFNFSNNVDLLCQKTTPVFVSLYVCEPKVPKVLRQFHSAHMEMKKLCLLVEYGQKWEELYTFLPDVNLL